MKIKVITDSAADYERNELEEKGIICVPLTINFAEQSYLDGEELSKEEFYKLLLEGDDFPMTAQPSPEAFLRHFREAKENGEAVVAILLSAGLSGTYQSAMIARGMADYDQIYVIDSLTAVTGLRLLVDAAVKMRDAGVDGKDIADRIESIKERVKLVAMVDTLEYLHRGGRLTKAQAKLGGLANLKPIISLDHEEGKIFVHDKCLGRGRAYKKLLEALKRFKPDPEYPAYFVYSHKEANCRKFIQMAEKELDYIDSSHMYDIGPTIGTHVGSGAFGFTCIMAEPEKN